MANVNGLLRSLLGHDHDCACVFLDNTVNMLSAEELQELYGDELAHVTGAFEEALEAIRRAAVGNAPFQCADIESTLAERDVGRDMIEREQAAIALGEAAIDALEEMWANLPTQEPSILESQLQDAAQAAREKLYQQLAAKTKPDLEPVMASVLDSYDGSVVSKVASLLFENRSAASSANRSLRVRLAEDYTAYIGEQSSAATTPHERYDAIYRRYHSVVVDFVSSSRGGPLAWQPFLKLQEQLRMEQCAAREQLFRQDLVDGKELPPISPIVKEPKELALLLGPKAAPGWLQAADTD